MNRISIVIVRSALLVLAGLGTTYAQGSPPPITLLQHVTIVDAKGQRVAEDVSVLVEDHRIAKIAASITAPAGATVIDAGGRVLAPGVVAAQGQTRARVSAGAGAIEKGAPADLLLIDGDPPEDLSTLADANVVLIMKDGAIEKNTLTTSDPAGGEQKPIPSTDLRDPQRLLTGAELVADDFPGSWPMFGTNMRMKIGGYLKADVVYDIDGTLDKTQFLMSTIPLEGTPEHADSGYFYMFARETRFNIDVRRVTPGAVPLRMFIEGDFWSAGNQFRLRHAYIVAGNFLVGQTWTTLSFVESLAFTIDFGAGDALFGGRTTQIRYQRGAGDHWKLAVAVENLDFPGIENPYGLAGKPSPQLPLFAVRADYRWKTGLLLLGSSVAQLRWDGGADGPTAKALQADVVVAGRQYVGTNNYVTWNVSYGEGSGENVMAFAGSHANAVLSSDGTLETMPAFAVVLGGMHKWNATLSSNLSYAYGWLRPPDSRDPLALKRGGIGHVNVIWRPATQFSTGVEYMWGTQRATNDTKGSARRIQGMVKFDF